MASEDLTPPPPPPPHSSLFPATFLHSSSHFFNNLSSPSSALPNPLCLSSPPTSINHTDITNHYSNNPLSPFQLYPHSSFPLLPLTQNNGKYSRKAHLSEEATAGNHSNMVADHILDPQFSPIGKRKNRSKVSKKAISGVDKLNAGLTSLESLNGLNPATGCRYDSSLGLLTKKFVKLVQDEDGILDLNRSADVLQVQKRRIYDITNVLEGIDLIEKTSKNHIRWKGYDSCGSKELDVQATKLKDEVQRFNAEECRLDESIREKQHLLRALEENEINKQYLFLTEEDITTLSCFQNQTLIAVKAPQASYLEVPDPDEDVGSPQYKMIIRSNTGPIDLYLLSNYKQKGEEVDVQQVREHSSSAEKCGLGRMVAEELCLDQQKNQNNVNEIFSSMRPESCGMQKILPSDCDIDDDYWFQSNPEVSISELWG